MNERKIKNIINNEKIVKSTDDSQLVHLQWENYDHVANKLIELLNKNNQKSFLKNSEGKGKSKIYILNINGFTVNVYFHLNLFDNTDKKFKISIPRNKLISKYNPVVLIAPIPKLINFKEIDEYLWCVVNQKEVLHALINVKNPSSRWVDNNSIITALDSQEPILSNTKNVKVYNNKNIYKLFTYKNIIKTDISSSGIINNNTYNVLEIYDDDNNLLRIR
ncbi:MAG: hypothetical protein HRS57_00725, partial [Mycoplasmataceae bacterium]|nr:hypothetical protein [Mycoplasmataceae bacterium]